MRTKYNVARWGMIDPHMPSPALVWLPRTINGNHTLIVSINIILNQTKSTITLI